VAGFRADYGAMRADRLVAVLLMLQARGRVTAAEVAAELEISERTARRDLEALGMAGLPVYSLQGRNGGWRLSGGGRTDLSGLSAAEARALFLVAGPSSAATPELRAALRKLVRALPESFRTQAESARSAVVVDRAGWDRPGQARPSPPHLDAVQQAVIDGEQLVLGYVDRDGSPTSRLVHPLGLAAKGWAWYLVADTDAGRRTFRVDRVTSIEPTGLHLGRPAGFDLEATWSEIITEVDRMRCPVLVQARVEPEATRLCRWVFGHRMSIGPAVPDGRVEVRIRGHSERSLTGELAGLGQSVEVVDPPGIREGLGRLGRGLATLYRAEGARGRAPGVRAAPPGTIDGAG
jgi:predicted DNA-binding transcriptional regulator YafY